MTSFYGQATTTPVQNPALTPHAAPSTWQTAAEQSVPCPTLLKSHDQLRLAVQTTGVAAQPLAAMSQQKCPPASGDAPASEGARASGRLPASSAVSTSGVSASGVNFA